MKVIFLDCTNLDFESNGEKVKGTHLKFIERKPPKGEKPESYVPGKQWIRADQTELVRAANKLIPGELIELDYSLEGKTVVFSGITSTGELAVDFDKIFNKKEE